MDILSEISIEYLRKILSYDFLTGIFINKVYRG